MNTIESKLQSDLVDAMKSRDSIKMDAIKSIKTAIMESKTAVNGNKNPSDADVLKIIQKIAKQRKESGEIYEQNNRPDLAKKEFDEYEIVSKYLPQMLSEDEVDRIVEETIQMTGSTSMKDMRKILEVINKQYTGQVDGSMVAKKVKEKLTK